MSFYKYYPNRKDHRKQYRDSRRFDATCKNHGSCSYCRDKRLYRYNKEIERTDNMLKEFYGG